MKYLITMSFTTLAQAVGRVLLLTSLIVVSSALVSINIVDFRLDQIDKASNKIKTEKSAEVNTTMPLPPPCWVKASIDFDIGKGAKSHTIFFSNQAIPNEMPIIDGGVWIVGTKDGWIAFPLNEWKPYEILSMCALMSRDGKIDLGIPAENPTPPKPTKSHPQFDYDHV